MQLLLLLLELLPFFTMLLMVDHFPRTNVQLFYEARQICDSMEKNSDEKLPWYYCRIMSLYLINNNHL